MGIYIYIYGLQLSTTDYTSIVASFAYLFTYHVFSATNLGQGRQGAGFEHLMGMELGYYRISLDIPSGYLT